MQFAVISDDFNEENSQVADVSDANSMEVCEK